LIITKKYKFTKKYFSAPQNGIRPDKINKRPRKKLNYYSPKEKFDYIAKKRKNSKVAVNG